MNEPHTPGELLDRLITLALDEDIATGDLATNAIIPAKAEAKAVITAKAPGVLSGVEVAKKVIDRLGSNKFTALVADGERISVGDALIEIEARYDALLMAERTMLNFLQRMSGIATATRQIVDLLEGTHTCLLDTRKTVPGHRVTDKIAVKHGGGTNHRMGLYDMAMLKDNHIKVAGGVENAILQAKKKLPLSVKIEVETTSLEEVRQAVKAGADIIMLDNMTPELMTEAVQIIGGKALTEASGNVTAATVEAIAATGVDFVSMGALTHTVKALDMSMNFVIS